MAIKFSSTVYNVCKYMFVDQELNYREVSGELDGKPSWRQIQRWALTKNEDGKTWKDLRDEKRDMAYEFMSPDNLANTVFKDLKTLIESDADPIKKGDAISKYQRFIEKILDPKYQVNMTLFLLKDLAEFMQLHYPQIINAELFDAFKAYKAHRLERIVNRAG